MTRAEAEEQCRRLEREHPDRRTNRWVPRETDGDWAVVRIPLPPGLTRGPLREVVEAKPRPPQADDPRPAPARDAPGAWG